MEHIEIPARLGEIGPVIGCVAKSASQIGFESQAVRAIELAVEEALVNICNYAYGRASGTIKIQCVPYGRSGLRVCIADNGTPFDVLASPAPDLCDDISQRAIGGLGIHLIRSFADVVRYRRCGDMNVLIMLFRRR